MRRVPHAHLVKFLSLGYNDNMRILKNLLAAAAVILLLLGLPLLGVTLSGQDPAQYFEFPPLTHYVVHAPFSWTYFLCLACLVLAAVLPLDIRVFFKRKLVPACKGPVRSLPWWGWAGLLLGIIAWVLAWTRFPWFKALQLYTFFPQWFSYIVVVNALAYRRTGRCMLLNRPAYFIALFPVSAFFWWFFEYLNRFVQNWYYVGEESFTQMQYFLAATLCFATVLPAVLGTYELLKSFPRVAAGLDHFVPIRIKYPRAAAGLVLAAGCAGMLAIGLLPDYLYPLLWMAPLILVTAVQSLRGQETVFTPLAKGDWSRFYTLALAALLCGLFWETWNYYSMAKWIYEVPFVSRFKVFEMPILGFAGYLPFGLECAVLADMLKSPALNSQRPTPNAQRATVHGPRATVITVNILL